MIVAGVALAVLCVASIAAGLSVRAGLARSTLTARRPAAPTRLNWWSLAREIIGPDWLSAAVAVWLMLLDTALALAAPWPVKIVIDQVLGHHAFPRALSRLSHADPMLVTASAAGTGLVLLATGALVGYLVTYLTAAIAERAAGRLRMLTMSHLLSVPPSEATRFPLGELVNRVNADTLRVADTLVSAVETLIPELSVLAGMLAIASLLDWRLTLVAVAVIPLFAFTARLRSRALGPAQRRARTHAGELASLTTDLLSRIPAVHVFDQAPVEMNAYSRVSDGSARTTLEATDASARFAPVIETLPGVGLAAALIAGAIEVRTGHLTVGGLVVFLAYMSSLTAPVRALAGLSATLSRGAASRDRVVALLSIAPMQAPPNREPARHATVRPHRSAPGLALHRVSYARGPNRHVLCEFSISVHGGETVCLSGPSGAGKTTILSLLCRLIEPDTGHITIGGRALPTIPLTQLRRLVSLVPQDPWLHAGSIADNIRYGRPDATVTQVHTAIAHAGLSDFVSTLPAGSDTQIGEHGFQLSGGQQRRIAVARALVRDTPILLLDEPTTGLDRHAEADLTTQLARVAHGRTVLLVTHRPELARIADRIIAIHGPAAAKHAAPESIRRDARSPVSLTAIEQS